jgi:3-oxoacyl-[acyl-carrier protein] reductase
MMELTIPPEKRVLITGASGDIGISLLGLLSHYDIILGLQYYSSVSKLEDVIESDDFSNCRINLFQSDLSRTDNCIKLVDSFVSWAGGIDYVVQLAGGVKNPISWEFITDEEWHYDIDVNLTASFFIAQQAMRHMKRGGGKIILMGTASAKHGGGKTSVAYGVAKAGIECLTKGLAREGAPYNILVNCICPGFINTQFHTKRMKRTPEELKKRAELVPLKRAGEPIDVAGIILYLLSESGNYITGEAISISGGDWL